MQEKATEISGINPRDYYDSLTKKEKGLFLKHLVMKYDFNIYTLRQKLGNKYKHDIKKIELDAIINEIKSEEWKR